MERRNKLLTLKLHQISCLIFTLFPNCIDTLVAPSYTEHDFINNIPDAPHFVMFYAPWCSHCQRLVPLWDKLAETFSAQQSRIQAAKVDCTIETPLCAREDVKAYPTLRLFHDGEKATYRGSRDILEFVKFTDTRVAEKSEKTTDGSNVELDGYKFQKEVEHGLKFVNFYAPWCSHCQKLAPVWNQLAEEMRYNDNIKILKVDCSKEKSVCNSFNVRAFPSLMVLHQGMLVENYEGDRSLENLHLFVQQIISKYIPTTDENDPSISEPIEAPDVTDDEVLNLRRDNFKLAIESGKTFVYFFAPWCKYCKQFSPIWKELAKKVMEKGLMIKIAKVDCTKELDLCKHNKITSYPSLILFKTPYNAHVYKGRREIDSMYKFLKQHEHTEL